ncbi:TPA: AAA family ATPase [Stenotrophomonas maltophilia]
MLRLTVENFSCIREAELEINPFTILIGPQASGKSVLSKLVYFFIDQVNEQYKSLLEGLSFDDFTSNLKTSFAEWFPTAAWGEGKFKIGFEMGLYRIKLARTSYDDAVKDGIRITTSTVVKEHYRKSAELLRSLRSKAPNKRGLPEYASELDIQWKLREASDDLLRKDVGRDAVTALTFIPAGRSFFTTLGRAFVAFDQNKSLDPATLNFGRLYANISTHVRFLRQQSRRMNQFETDLASMLGGQLVYQGSEARFKCDDGRTMPLAALSSGQQELLPLVSTLTVLSHQDEDRHLIFIEEPEAHLFPESQSKLIATLAQLVNDAKRKRTLFITTHSPYVLSKINNLLKAGALASKLSNEKAERLAALVPAAKQLKPHAVAAYALVNGVLVSLVDGETGLIDADYLDSASGRIGDEFSDLLELEYGG